MENKTNTGAIFKNDKKTNEKQPDYRGKVNVNGKEMENKATFEQAVKPLMKWLCENAHPHTTAIVYGTLAQLVEGVENVKTNEFLVD